MGDFIYVDDDDSWRGLARWDGRRWRRLSIETNWPQSTMLAFRDDVLIASASYSASPLWRWNGSTLEPFISPPWSYVSSLGVYQDSIVASGDSSIGQFDEASASWNLLGGEFEQSTPETPWASGMISAMREFAGELYVCGRFTHADGVPANNLARWNGISWRPVGAGVQSISSYPSTLALEVYRDALIVAGHFERADEVSVDNIAGWDGTAWFGLADGLWHSNDPTVIYALETYNNELIAGGNFNRTGSQPLASPARWDGRRWSDWGIALGAQPGSSERVKALRVVDGDLWLGGNFTYVGSDYCAMLVRRGPLGRRGDSDGMAPVDLRDVDCFVAALVGPAAWDDCYTSADPEGYLCANDVNRDGQVDFNDIDEFVTCIAMGCEQPTP